MAEVVSIKEYEKLKIRPERDLIRKIISVADAALLQSIVVDNSPVFSCGNRCLIAQQYVGVIEMPDYTIEILPKLYGEVDNDRLRDVLIRMLLVTNQSSTIRQFKASVAAKKNALSEIIIQSFLRELRIYVESGLQHEYKKMSGNIDKVKGQIVFSQQLKRNILAPTRFYCKYSKYIADNELNRFLKCCLSAMNVLSRDSQNKKLLEDLYAFFDEISLISVEEALSYQIEFTSINARAKETYIFGKMFLNSLYATLNAGASPVYTMMFDMEKLYELFIYRVAAMIFRRKVTYQKKGGYMVSRNSDGKRFICLRPDLTLNISKNEQWIIDMKWKLPSRFAKESDVYQMNAYSTSIRDVRKVVLLYPKVPRTDHLEGYYTLSSNAGSSRSLEIRMVNLLQCLNWSEFLNEFKALFDVNIRNDSDNVS